GIGLHPVEIMDDGAGIGDGEISVPERRHLAERTGFPEFVGAVRRRDGAVLDLDPLLGGKRQGLAHERRQRRTVDDHPNLLLRMNALRVTRRPARTIIVRGAAASDLPVAGLRAAAWSCPAYASGWG